MKIKLLFLGLFVLSLNSCTESSNCGENNAFWEKYVSVRLIDKNSGKDLIAYGTSGGKYNPSKLEIIHKGQIVEHDSAGRIQIYNWITPYEYDTIYQLDYLINLYDWDNNLNQDSILIRYEAGERECYDDIEYMEFIYNDSLIYSGGENFFMHVRL